MVNNPKFHGLEKQDEFAWILLHNIKDGYFLDVACQHPIEASNTYVFEKELEWTGLAFDWVTSTSWTGPFNWEQHRPNTTFINMDIRTPEFTQKLLEIIPSNKIVDYVSLDVDTEIPNVGHVNMGWFALSRLINGGIRFKVMTLEHEFYSQGERVRLPSRLLLEALGYRRLFSDVSHKNKDNGQLDCSEDWWINPKYFPQNIFDYSGEKMWWNDCVEKIKGYKI
jgi:hypothetical protein